MYLLWIFQNYITHYYILKIPQNSIFKPKNGISKPESDHFGPNNDIGVGLGVWRTQACLDQQERKRRETLNDGNNNGQLHIVNATSCGARKAVWAKTDQ